MILFRCSYRSLQHSHPKQWHLQSILWLWRKWTCIMALLITRLWYHRHCMVNKQGSLVCQVCATGQLCLLIRSVTSYSLRHIWAHWFWSLEENREFKIYDATGSTTRLRKKEICHARQKLWINLWSQGYSQRLCHAQQNVKLSIITSFKQREAYCDPKGDT
jgi:hypothetical protein